MRRLAIYDTLRESHHLIKNVMVDAEYEQLDDWDKNAIEAVDAVLYLAEGVFAQVGKDIPSSDQPDTKQIDSRNPYCPYCSEMMSKGDGSYWCLNSTCPSKAVTK